MSIYLVGFSFVFLISCMMNYQVGLLESLSICLLGFIVSRSFIRNMWTSVITIVVLLLTALVGGYILYRVDALEFILVQINDFIEPYLLSMNQGDDFKIDLVRQSVIMGLISVIVYKLLYTFRKFEVTYIIFYISGFSLCIIGFLMDLISSNRDYLGFKIIFISMILQYFYRVYQSKNHRLKSFAPYIVLSVIMFVSIYGGASLLYKSNQRPLHFPTKQVVVTAVGYTPTDEIRLEKRAIKKINITQDGVITNEFKSEGKELFRVSAVTLKYLKGSVYENYENGVWKQSENGLVYSLSGSIYPWEGTDEVEVKYSKINSDILYVGGSELLRLTVPDSIKVIADDERMTYQIAELDEIFQNEDLIYSFNTVTTNWRDSDYVNALKESKQAGLPFDFEESKYVLSEGYEDIHQLALEVTKNAQNDYERIQLIRKYFVDNFTYTTIPNVQELGEMDSIRYFLFTSQEGFCQHFASAEVLMLQSLGIPARYVVGFMVPEISEEVVRSGDISHYYSDGYWIITDSQAHAWFEVYFPGIGWETFEATPGFAPLPMEPFMLGEAKEQKDSDQNNFEIPVETIIIIGTIFVFILLIVVVVVLIRRRSRYNHQTPSIKILVNHHVILEYFKLLGQPKKLYETQLEYASRMDHWLKDLDLGGSFQEIIAIFEKVAYGEYELSSEDFQPYLVYKKFIGKIARKRLGVLKCLRIKLKEFMISP